MKMLFAQILMFLFLFTIRLNAQTTEQKFEEMHQKIERQNQEIQKLRNRVTTETSRLKQEIDSYAPIALVLFLFGGFCALWAQNTDRNPWGWFFGGVVLSVFAVIFVLSINAQERRS